MSLIKLGSHLRILKTAAVAEDLLVEKPMAEVTPTKILEQKNSDFLYYRARAISAGDQGPLNKDGSRGWNFNGNKDYFPRKELESSYETFVGRNIFLDHNSESSLYSIGKIIDAVPVDDKETGEFYIELVGKIDRTLHPEICRKIETGELNSTSMGCSVDESICSICGHVLHSDADEKCDHMGMNLGKQFPAEVDFPEYNIKQGDMVPCFSINKGIVFNEDSIVGVPADPSAVIKTVLSNMKSRMSKKASLTKEEQLDLAAQMEKLFAKLDDSTKIQLKADFCGICPPVEKESSMADKSVVPNEETKKILNKISAYEMEQLESYVQHKTKKANEAVTKEVVADSTAKEESFLSKIVAKVKDALSKEDKKPTLSAKFTEDKNNVLDSTWSVHAGEKCLLEASLKDIWGSKFETLSFDDQLWATSGEYAKEAVYRLVNSGLPKLASDWDVTPKIEKIAENGEFFKAKDFFVGGSDSANDWKPEYIKSQDEKDGHVVTEYTFKFPGQVDSKGQTNSSIPEVKTVYPIKRPEGSDFVGGSDSSNNYKADEVKAADGGNKGGYGHVKTEYSFKRQPGKEFVGGSDSSNDMTPDEIKRASLKTAEGPELGPDGTYAKPTTGLSNKKHDYPTTPKFTDPKPGADSKGPAAPAGKDVKTEYKIDMPGQEAGQKGPAAPKPMTMKTDYSEPKPEAEGKEVKTTPKNPDEKKHDKSEKEVETDYVAAGTEAMEAEEKGKKEEKSDKKSYKEQNALIKWSAMSPEAQEFIKKHVEKHIKEDGMERDQAVAAAYSEAREKGMNVPEKKSSQETIMEKKAADKPVESVDGSTLPEGKKTMGDKVEESVQGTTVPGGAAPSAAPETSAQGDKEHKTPDLTKKPDEAVDGTTLPPQGKKDEESSEKTTHPDGKKSMGDESEKSVQASKSESSAPEEAVQDKPALSKKTMGDKAEQSSQGDTEPAGTVPNSEPDAAVNKSAATEMPMPEDKDPMESMKPEAPVDEKPLDLPMDGPKVDEPMAEVSAFDSTEVLDIGEGYSAHKDKETKEVIVEKDGKEVKRLPDGFGKDVAVVLPLMKAVLGLPPEANNKQDMPDFTKPMDGEVKEEVKVEEHPGAEEAHEDELGLKESSLKVKEAALAEKEAAIAAKEAEIKAKEDAEKQAETSRKFASVLQVRSERCKKIVSALVAKDAIQMDKAVYESELQNGTYLLDAQKKAFEHAITAKNKELLAMDDNALLATEKVVADLKTPVTKKASHIFVSPSFGEELSDDQQLKKIFDTMGTKNRPQ